MSYNIDTWKTKKIENLTIPLNSLYTYARKDWHPDQPKIIAAETMEVVIEGGSEGFELKGNLKGIHIEVTEITNYGEGSGSFMEYVLYKALEQSTGELEAVLVWEGGDSITRLTVKDGEAEESDVEL